MHIADRLQHIHSKINSPHFFDVCTVDLTHSLGFAALHFAFAIQRCPAPLGFLQARYTNLVEQDGTLFGAIKVKSSKFCKPGGSVQVSCRTSTVFCSKTYVQQKDFGLLQSPHRCGMELPAKASLRPGPMANAFCENNCTKQEITISFLGNSNRSETHLRPP